MEGCCFDSCSAVLLVLAVIPSAYCLGEGTPYIPTEEGVYYHVRVINETSMEDLGFKPEHFWTLNDPDPYILKAIKHPRTFVLTDIENFVHPAPETFLHKFYAHECYPYFYYNGTYCDFGTELIYYSETGRSGGYPSCGHYWKVKLLDEEPEDYVEVTDPNPYLKACLEHPGKWVMIDDGYFRDHPEAMSLDKMPSYNIKYEGKYYRHDGSRYVDGYGLPPEGWSKEVIAGIGVSAFAVAAVAFTVYRKRKTNQK